MEMEDSLRRSLEEMVQLQKQQLIKLNDMTLAQVESNNIENRKNQMQQPNAAPTQSTQGSYFQNPYIYNAPNYAPPVIPPYFNPSAGINSSFNEFQNFAHEASGQGGKYGFMDAVLPPSSRVSKETQAQLTQDYWARTANAAVSGGGALAQLGVSGLAFRYGGLVGGMAMSAAGGALVGGYFDAGIEEMKKNQAYQKYLQRESYRFINPMESNNTRGLGGFSRDERADVADFLRTTNTDFGIKDDEMMRLLQKYTDGGLMKDVSDTESFKNQITKLTKSVKAGALMLNETYDSIAELMGDMKKMGFDSKNYTQFMSLAKVVGGMNGKDASETIRTLMEMVGGAVSGTAKDSDLYMNRMIDTSFYVSEMYDSLKARQNLSPKEAAARNYIQNIGGAENATMQINALLDGTMENQNIATSAASFFDFNAETGSWEMNRGKFNSFITGDIGYHEILKEADKKVNAAGTFATKDWLENANVYMSNSLTSGDVNKFVTAILRGANRDMGAPNVNDLSSSLATLMPNITDDQRMLLSNFLETYETEGDRLALKQRNLAFSENLSSTIQSQRLSFGERLSGWWENTKDSVTGGFVNFGNTMMNAGEDLNEWLYGKKFYSADFNNINDGWTPSNNAQDIRSALGSTANALNSAKDLGYNVNLNLLNSLGDYTGSVNNRYSYQREIYTDPSQLTGLAREHYGTISDSAKKNDLSETILAALVKFAGSNEGKELMGASKETIKQIKDNNSLNVQDPEAASTEMQIKLVAEQMGKFMELYGGNEKLSEQAFFMGQSAVDAALRNAGYDLDALRQSGNQGQLQNVKIDNITNNTYGSYQDYKNNSGVNVKYNVEGVPVIDGPLYKQSYNYERGSKVGQNGDVYYDDIQFLAQELGISPNLLATTMAQESNGVIPTKQGAAGEWGIMQVRDVNLKNFIGDVVTLPDGSTTTITADAMNEMQDPYKSLYMGGTMLKNSLNAAQGNPYLAYAGYNAGNGHLPKVISALNSQGVEVPGASLEQVVFALQSVGLNQAAINVGRWGEKYASGLIDATDVTSETEEVEPETKTETVTKTVRQQLDELDESLKIKKSAKGHFAPSDMQLFSELSEKATGKSYISNATGELVHTKGKMTLDDKEEALRAFAKMKGIKISDDFTDIEQVNVMAEYETWHNKNYEDIKAYAAGNTNNAWGRKSLTEKAQEIKVMDTFYNSEFLSAGLDLENVKKRGVGGNQYRGAFSDEEMEEMKHINYSGEYDAKKKYLKWDPLKGYTKWLENPAIDYSKLTDKNLNDLMSRSTKEAVAAIDQEVINLDDQYDREKTEMASFISKVKGGKELKTLTQTQRDKVLTAINTGDLEALEDIRLALSNSKNTKGALGLEKAIDYTEKVVGTDDVRNALLDQKDAIQKQVAVGQDIAKAGDMVAALFMEKDEADKFTKRIDFRGLSTDRALSYSPEELSEKIKGAYGEIMDTLSEKITTDLDGFMKTLSERGYDNQVIDQIMESSGLSLDGKGKVVVTDGKMDAEKASEVASAFLDAMMGELGTGNSVEQLGAAGTDFSKATEDFVGAITDALEIFADGTSAVSGIQTRQEREISNLKQAVVSIRNNTGPRNGYSI